MKKSKTPAPAANSAPEPLRIRMKTTAAGPGGNYQNNQVYTAPGNMTPEQAQAFVAGGYAEVVKPAEPPAAAAPTPAAKAGEATVTVKGDQGGVAVIDRIRSRTGGKAKADRS